MPENPSPSPSGIASESGGEYDDLKTTSTGLASRASPTGVTPKPPPVTVVHGVESDANLGNCPAEIKELFQFIGKYAHVEIDMEPELKPFIPELIPAIGDIDAFIKIPRPDNIQDKVGFVELDEPNIKQSDPHVLELQLRSVLKVEVAPIATVRTIEAITMARDSKPIDNWIQSVKEIHANKPPPTVVYTREMPNIEELMQVWPAKMEDILASGVMLPSAELDLPLDEYARLISVLLDVPLPSKNAKMGSNKSHLVEALHLIFRLYAEFKNSDHFKNVQV